MVTVSIIERFLTSGGSFSIQVRRDTLGDVTLTLTVDGKARNFGIDGGPAQARVTLEVFGGAPKDFVVNDWGTAPQGSPVKLTATIPEGKEVSASKRVGL